jgi:hypothetical protein
VSTTPSTLLDYLAEVPDFRRKEGKRYPLPSLLLMIIMAIMSGHNGYREIARFLGANADRLRAHLGLKRAAMPSHVTIRTVLQGLDFHKLNEAFAAWAAAHLDVAPGSFLAVDAKAVRSTVSDYENAYQDFVAIVSAFSQHEGTVVAMKSYPNKAESEIVVARDLIETLSAALGLRGVIWTMDALHCKKNASDDRLER